jgi:site-specific recombinase XerD
MRSREYAFSGIFAGEIESYLKLRESRGHKHLRERHHFVALDGYLCNENVTAKELSAHIIEGWLQSLSPMSVNTKIVYISHYTQFAKYLHTLGIKAFIPERPIDDKTYIPYVFTEDEMARMFSAADNLKTQGKSSFPTLQFPIILRILAFAQ